MFTGDLLIVFVSLSLSGIWLLYKAVGFQGLPKIDDPKGILIPSVVFLSSPFISLYLLHFLAIEEIEEIIKPLVPLATFLLGQALTKREKQENEKQKKIEFARSLILNIEETIIGTLSQLERMLATSQDKNEIENSSEFKSCCEQCKLKIEELHSQLRFKSEIFKSNAGINSLVYMRKIQAHLEFIASSEISSSDRLTELSYIRVFKIEVYENIIYLIQELIPKNNSNYSLFNSYIARLKKEHVRLVKLHETYERKILFWKNKPNEQRELSPKEKLLVDSNINPCEKAIEAIVEIFNRFDIVL